MPYPLPYLNRWLYKAEIGHDFRLPIPYEIIYGFSNCGLGWLGEWESYSDVHKAWLTSEDVHFPPRAIIKTSPERLEWVKPIRDSQNQLYHFIFCLRRMMLQLVFHPIGEPSTPTLNEVVKKITNLPRGTAFVKVGDTITELKTLNIRKRASSAEVTARKTAIIEQTRRKYCRPATIVEKEIQKRLGLDAADSAAPPQSSEDAASKQPPEEQAWQPFDEV